MESWLRCFNWVIGIGGICLPCSNCSQLCWSSVYISVYLVCWISGVYTWKWCAGKQLTLLQLDDFESTFSTISWQVPDQRYPQNLVTSVAGVYQYLTLLGMSGTNPHQFDQYATKNTIKRFITCHANLLQVQADVNKELLLCTWCYPIHKINKM